MKRHTLTNGDLKRSISRIESARKFLALLGRG